MTEVQNFTEKTAPVGGDFVAGYEAAAGVGSERRYTLDNITKALTTVSASNQGVVPQSNLAATTAPLVTDDSASGYSVFSFWVDVTNDAAYICLDATTSAAVWNQIGGFDEIAFVASRIIGAESGDSAYKAMTAAETKTLLGYLTDVADDTTPQLGGELDAQGNVISTPIMKDYEIENDSPAISSGTLTLNYANGPDFDVTLDANVTTLSVSNWPASGNLGKVSLQLKQDGTGSRTVAWGSVRWPGGTAPTVSSVANDVDEFVLWTRDGGTTVYGAVVGQDFA